MTARSFEVLLSDQPVGLLTENDDGRIGIRFADSYKTLSSRPVLSQSFEDDLNRVYWGRRRAELPAFFANMLPEGRFREILEKSLALREADDLGLLAAVAEDLPGAVTLRPAVQEVTEFSGPTEATANGANGGAEQFGFHFSLAGVQLKFSMVRQDNKLALPAHGQRGDWIVKVGADQYPGLAENEYSILQWAKRAGFEIPDCELANVDDLPQIGKYTPKGSRVLVVRRFDRSGGRRIHQEDFMQVFGWSPAGDRKYNATYEELAVVIYGLLGTGGYEEFIRRLALVVASGNNDAHLKNWSLVYKDGMTPSMAPVYDQVATVAWEQLDRGLALKLAGARDFSRINSDSFRRLGRKSDVNPERSLDIARETLVSLRERWKDIVHETPILEAHALAVREHWLRVPLLRELGDLPTK